MAVVDGLVVIFVLAMLTVLFLLVGRTNCLLYSIGPDGGDDGGRPAGRGLSGKGDILFDSTW